jgi:hypothetical protein
MPPDHDKQCLDDSIMVDTSSARSRGCSMTVAIAETMND